MKTTHENAIELGKILTKIRSANNWTIPGFMQATKHTYISKQAAARFFRALVKSGYIRKDGLHFRSNIDINIFKNEDAKINFIKELLHFYPDIIQKKGKVAGKDYSKKVTSTELAVIVEDETNSLEGITSGELVDELRRRGYEVTASRQIIMTETL